MSDFADTEMFSVKRLIHKIIKHWRRYKYVNSNATVQPIQWPYKHKYQIHYTLDCFQHNN